MDAARESGIHDLVVTSVDARLDLIIRALVGSPDGHED